MILMKKILAVVLSVIMVFLLSSCKSSENTSSKEETVNNVSQPDKVEVENTVSQVESETSYDDTSKEINSYDTQSTVSSSQSQTSSNNTSSQSTQQHRIIRKITSAKDLKEFSNTVNAGHSYSGEEVTLEADIDLSGIEWVPIGTYSKPFKGTFLGNGHTIKNLTITTITDQMLNSNQGNLHIGLFGLAEDATITNLKLTNVNISLCGNVGPSFIEVGSIVGSMHGRDKGINLTQCVASGNINVSIPQDKIMSIGGAVGSFCGLGGVDTSYNMRYIQSNVNITSEGFLSTVGGIAGKLGLQDSDVSDSIVSDLIYVGKVNDNMVERRSVGGLVGLFSSRYKCELKNCFVKLTLSKIGNNSYSDVTPKLGIFIGEETVNANVLKLENFYGCAILNNNVFGLARVGTQSNTVSYVKCFETDEIPQEADSVLINWNLSNRAFPTFNF
jgi:hypothetical protein